MLGILSIPGALIPIIGLALGVLAIVLGAIARKDILRDGLPGASTAKTAIVLGSIGTLLAIANAVVGVIVSSSTGIRMFDGFWRAPPAAAGTPHPVTCHQHAFRNAAHRRPRPGLRQATRRTSGHLH